MLGLSLGRHSVTLCEFTLCLIQFYVQREKEFLVFVWSFTEEWDLLYFVTLKFKDLLLLVAHPGYVLPSDLYTNGFDSRSFNRYHNELYLIFILLLAELMTLWVENENYRNLFDITRQTHHIEGNRNGISPAVHLLNLNFMTNQM